MTAKPKVCPVCGKKNVGTWVYTCLPCWHKFIEWTDEKYGDRRKKPISQYLPEYIVFFNRHNGEKVEFT